MTRPYLQATAIPYRPRGNQLEVALVTSTGGKRWVLPKGSIDPDEQPWDAALREAEEEAGLLGQLEGPSLGQYHYTKENRLYRVEVYLMRVTMVLESWPEVYRRRRSWLSVEQAAGQVSGDLRPFVRAVEGLVQLNR